MAGVKISNLPVSPGLDGTELVPIVDAGVTRRTTVAAIAGAVDLSDYINPQVHLTATDSSEGAGFHASVGSLGAIEMDSDIGVYLAARSGNPLSLRAEDGGNIIINASGGLNSTITIQGWNLGMVFDGLNHSIGLETFGDGGNLYITGNGIDAGVTISAPDQGGNINIIAGIDGAVTIGDGDLAVPTYIRSETQVSISTSGNASSVGIFASGTGSTIEIGANGPGGTLTVLAVAGLAIGIDDQSAGIGFSSDDGGTVQISATGGIGFFGASPVPQQTGVAVTAAALHAALVALGLITA